MKSHAILPESSNSIITFGLTTEVAPASTGVDEMSVITAPALDARPNQNTISARRVTVFMVSSDHSVRSNTALNKLSNRRPNRHPSLAERRGIARIGHLNGDSI